MDDNQPTQSGGQIPAVELTDEMRRLLTLVTEREKSLLLFFETRAEAVERAE